MKPRDVDFKEVEANQFAMHLLVPTEMLAREVEKLKVQWITPYHIEKLAKLFCVDQGLMVLRLVEDGHLSRESYGIFPQTKKQ